MLTGKSRTLPKNCQSKISVQANLTKILSQAVSKHRVSGKRG